MNDVPEYLIPTVLQMSYDNPFFLPSLVAKEPNLGGTALSLSHTHTLTCLTGKTAGDFFDKPEMVNTEEQVANCDIP